jgi:uncharacterized protein (TIGR03067 family)
MGARLSGASSCALLVVSIGIVRGQALEGDLARLQGRWVTTATGPRQRTSSTAYIDIKGTTVRFTVKMQNGRSSGTTGQLRIDETANPKTIDFIGTKSGLDERPDNFGIYELKSDTLTLCTGGPGARRPTRFQGSALGYPNLITYNRDLSAGPAAEAADGPGRPEPGRMKGPGRDTAAETRPLTQKGVTVVNVTPQRITLRTADGQDIMAIARGGRAFDARGNDLGTAVSVLRQGNVVDVMMVPIRRDTNIMSIQQARLVSGGLSEAGMAAQGETFKGAVVSQVLPNRVVLNINGKDVSILPRNPAAKAIDLDGNLLPAGSADRLLRVGNKVDVTLKTQQRKTILIPILEIHLVEGQLLAPAR